jgi:N-acetylmuramoyl-L-alanine amidase
MNNQNPLIPQGSALEQKNRGRARMKIAVFFVLAVHGVGLMALLMQGCGQSKEPTPPTETVATNQPPAFVEATNVPVATSSPPVAVTAPTAPETPAQSLVPAGATEYAIAKGDILEKIALKFHVTVKAITEANPGIEPTKLKIGQKIHIPAAATPTTATPAGAAPADIPSAAGEQTYTVKSGDNLTKIATQHGVSVKALRAANALKTDSIKVGQKLKIPAKAASAAATATTTPVEPAPASTAPSSPATPPGR